MNRYANASPKQGEGVFDAGFYRAEQAGSQWMCIVGNDWQAAPLYDTEEEAQEAADEMNGLYYADGRPTNASARAKELQP